MAKNQLPKMKTLTIQIRTTASNKDLKKVASLYFDDGKFLCPVNKESRKRPDILGILQVTVQDNTQ